MVVPIGISQLEEINRAYWDFYLSTLAFPMICLCSFILVSFCFCCSCSKRCMKSGAAECQCCCNLISLVAEWLLCFLKTSEDPEDEDAICPAAEGRTNNETNTPRSRSSYDVAMVETGQSTNDKLSKTTKDKVTIFIIYKQKAPFCYTIYLLYMVAVLFIHSIFAFFASAVVEPAISNYMYDNCNPDNETACLEIDLLSGVESLGIVFGFSVTAIAINTYFLLICTCYRYGIHHKRSDGDEDKCCVPCNCKCRVCCCSILTITIQLIGVVIPRVLLYYYIVYYGFVVRNNAGPFDHQSVFVIVAIMDAISLSCLTPWCCFKKLN